MMALLVTAICVMATVIALLAFVLIMTRNDMRMVQSLVFVLHDRIEVLEKKEVNHV